MSAAAKSQYQAPPLRLTADAGNAPTDMSHVRSAPSAACRPLGWQRKRRGELRYEPTEGYQMARQRR
ncbi:hypothetical protein VE02_09063 [Pseudogymnoascus sp. 03VT05]|nr:hypothetical protein VE02_09063 [Pseudogymnoascus sp. 03VT05]